MEKRSSMTLESTCKPFKLLEVVGSTSILDCPWVEGSTIVRPRSAAFLRLQDAAAVTRMEVGCGAVHSS